MTAAERRRVAQVIARNKRAAEKKTRQEWRDLTPDEKMQRAGSFKEASRVSRQVDATAKAKEAQKRRKARMLLELEKRVNRGELTHLQAREKMQAAGLLPGGAAAKALKGPAGFAAKVIGNVAEDALYTPAGLYQIGKASALDTRDLVTKGDVTPERFAKVAKDTGVSTYESLRHPLRRPGTTGLVALGVAAGGAGAVSRASAAGRALAAGGGLKGAVARPGYKGGSLLHRPAPGPRFAKTDSGETVRIGRYSASPLMRGGQKALDKARGNKGGFTQAGANRRIATDLSQERKALDAKERAPAIALTRKGAKLTAPQQMALRLAEETTPVAKTIARMERDMHRARRRAKKAGSKADADRARQEVAAIRYRMGLVQAASRYLEDGPDGEPVLRADFKRPRHGFGKKIGRRGASAKEMADLQGRVGRVSKTREGVLKDVGLLSDDQIEYRLSAPRRLVEGADYRSPRTASKLARERIRKGKAEAVLAERQIKKEMREQARSYSTATGKRDKAQRERFRLATTRGPEERSLIALEKSLSRRADELDTVAKSGGQLRQVQREVDVPRTKADVEARIAEIDKFVNPILSNLRKDARALDWITPQRTGKARKGQGEWVPRYKRGKPVFGEGTMRYSDKPAGEGRVGPAPTVNEQWDTLLRKQMEQVDAWLERNPGPSKMRTFRDLIDERAELNDLMQRNIDPDVVFGDAPPPGFGTKKEVQTIEELAEVDPAEHAAVMKQLADTQDELRRAELAREKLVRRAGGEARAYDLMAQDATWRHWINQERLKSEPKQIRSQAAQDALAIRGTGGKIVGADEFRGKGRSRIPDVPEVRKPQPFGISRWRGGAARPPASTTKGYTGGLRGRGNTRVRTTQLVGESGLEAQRYASVERLRERVVKFSRKERPEDTRLTHWQPVRLSTNLKASDKRLLDSIGKRAERGLAITPDERRVAQSVADRLTAEAFPKIEDLEAQRGGIINAGMEVPGVVWVPAKVLRDVNKHVSSGRPNPVVAGYDTFANLVKTGIIVAKPAYVVANTIGNLAFNLVQQGLLLPANWIAAVRLAGDADTMAAIDGAVGNGALSAFIGDDAGLIGGASKALHLTSDKLSLVTDLMFRRSAFVHEARRFGYTTKDDFRRLVTDKDAEGDFVEITNRSKAAIVDYDRMGPVERDIVRRATFIYPWVKGAAMYAGTFLLEHPVQAGVYSAVAQEGREQARRDLGPVPGYAEGTFKVGGSDDYPLVVDPSTVSPLSQAAELIRTGQSFASGRGGASEAIGQMANPVVEAAISAGWKRDLFTGRGLEGSFPRLFLGQVKESLAPAVLARGLSRAETNDERRSERTYPMTKAQVVTRFGVGSFAPRTANREQLNERARDDERVDWSPGKRAAAGVYDERRRLFEAIKKNEPDVLENGRLPKKIREAYNRRASVEAVRAEAERAYPSGLMRERVKLVQEARLAEKWGVVAPGTALELEKRAALEKSPKTVRSWRDRLRHVAFDPAYGEVTSRAKKYLDSVSPA